jgi:DNA-binding PadR family transcriptional regulator
MSPRPPHEAHDHLPLSPATLHILLALARADLHGYGIMLEVARQSAGSYKIGPGTLYDNLRKLAATGLVEEPPPTPENPTRRLYHLTDLGSAVLAAETDRLTHVLREARRCLNLQEEV